MRPDIKIKKMEIIQIRRNCKGNNSLVLEVESHFNLAERKDFSKKKYSSIWIIISIIALSYFLTLITLVLTNQRDLIVTTCTLFNTSVGICALFINSSKNS